jgi:hypothetical protein
LKKFIEFTLIWVSQNLAIPFWMVGHIHLMTTIYEEIHEILCSIGMNLIVLIGFILDYKNTLPKNKKNYE